MGVWLPLAMAQIYQVLVFIATAFTTKDGMKTPSTAEALRSFALPAMAEAMKREEAESKARQMFDSIVETAKRTGGKLVVS